MHIIYVLGVTQIHLNVLPGESNGLELLCLVETEEFML